MEAIVIIGTSNAPGSEKKDEMEKKGGCLRGGRRQRRRQGVVVTVSSGGEICDAVGRLKGRGWKKERREGKVRGGGGGCKVEKLIM